MLKKRIIGWALLLLCSTLFAEPRLWTNHDGKTTVAEFVALSGETVVLKKKNKTLRFPLASLSPQDQEHVRARVEEMAKKEETFSSAPLQIFGKDSYKGQRARIDPHHIYSGEGKGSGGSGIPVGLNNNISSLILKKGYQACIATTPDGIGPSKILIANKRDIRIPKLSKKFNDNIQFIRVLPWKNTIKKGHGGIRDLQALTEGWYYNWTGCNNAKDALGIQFVPMAFSHHKTQSKSWIESQINQVGITQILGFNEPDADGHEKNKHLGIQENCVQAMIPLMGTGLRIGGPGCTQGGIRRWYPDFIKEAEEKMLRIDFIAVHWYDWGSNPSSNPDDSPEDIFNRFKKYIERVYQQYKMPIWITEFNANPSRNEKTQFKFMKLAIPYLDSLDYVERYAWFQPVGVIDRTKGNGSFRETKGDASTPLTRIGIFWRDHPSVPSMDEKVYLGKNNLYKNEIKE